MSITFFTNFVFGRKSVHYHFLEDDEVITAIKHVSKATADSLFNYFKNYDGVFIWNDENNCEDRANGVCILLDKWDVPNLKAWVIDGKTLGKDQGSFYPVPKRHKGAKSITWTHHISAVVPVLEDGKIEFYVIDPSTQNSPVLLSDWAEKITENAFTYFFLKSGECVDVVYANWITRDSWYKRDATNYIWTMQGLAGYNGATKAGRRKIKRNTDKIITITNRFEATEKPAFLY